MTIRSALVGGLLLFALVVLVLVSGIGVVSINRSVIGQAQDRVGHDLRMASTLLDQRMDDLHRSLQSRAVEFSGTPLGQEDAQRLLRVRGDLDLDVLSICDVRGAPLLGAYPADSVRVPIQDDPLLREALAGRSNRGIVVLDPARLELEGGDALRRALEVRAGEDDPAGGSRKALLEWVAVPLSDATGRVTAILYGGRAVNHNSALVDALRDIIFGDGTENGRPLGTVTFFLGDTRVATNVRLDDGTRATGTRVSDEVLEAVLERGERWSDRAWVVNAWYLSAYEPLRDPEGRIVGMLYVGLLEAPYGSLRGSLLAQFLVPVGGVFLLGIVFAVLGMRRLTRPLASLREGAERIEAGDWETEMPAVDTYLELADLHRAFDRMQAAIRSRDARLNEQNRELAEALEGLRRANANYMQTLGFVTHELRSPLATIQTMIDVLVGGLADDQPEKSREMLLRIRRNCEELQDMVKNYLDLSRAERGELTVTRVEADLCSEIISPSVELTAPLFESRKVDLHTDCPAGVAVHLDVGLVRIALGNLLSNAAKYAREGGAARLEVARDAEGVRISVWNEGVGFTPDEGAQLFRKFSRLRNAATRGKRGSGLGLYLSRQIAELHGGTLDAESEPEHWARFSIRLPA